MRQRTLKKSVYINGRGLHTGEEVKVTLHPAEIDSGIVFIRSDAEGNPTVRCHIDCIATDLTRATALSENDVKIITPEHLLSAVCGMGITNIHVEMTASEVPILDGSAKPWAELIQEAGVLDQEKEAEVLKVIAPITIAEEGRSIAALPCNEFRITCISKDNKDRHNQHMTISINEESYLNEISSSRTFVFYEEIEPLIKMGKIKGGSIDSAIVIKDDQVVSKEPLRFKDELVRHKILDLVGDLALIGKPIQAHIIAICTGHAFNAQLTALLVDHMKQQQCGHNKVELWEKKWSSTL